jgi:ribonuclease Z
MDVRLIGSDSAHGAESSTDDRWLQADSPLASARSMDLSLFFAGTAGSVPTARRGLPALLLRAGGDRLLFDCGEGTQQQLLRSAVGLPELDAIFLTHFHLDHWLGVVGMLKTFDLRARERPLAIYGPPGLKALFAMLRPILGRTGYPLEVVELEPHEEIGFDGYLVSPFAVKHRVEAYGYAFVEDDRPGRFDVETARRLGLREGPDFGRLQRGETVAGVRPEQVMGETRPGRKVVISGDTAPCQAVEVFGHRADVLVHEATFMEDERARARETGHSTARQAAEIARDAEVRLLVLTHLSTRYFPRDIREEARAVFAGTIVPRDFDAVAVPFPERGEPALVKPEREAEPAGVAPAP